LREHVKISVIVPAFNEAKLIAASLASIHAAATAFTAAGWESELVVCDNNSTDRTAELARAAGATVVFEPVNQIARARNAGAAAATGDWFIFVDADSHVTAGLFADVVEIIRSGRCLGGGCTIRMESARWSVRAMVGLWNLISRCRRWAAGSFLFCSAEAFRAVGGFSPEMFAAEELDLSERLKRHARQTHRQFVILRRHPLVTSSRKTELYTTGDHLRMVANAVMRPRATLRNREACILWYDGRR
jgi:glycosyltransferase involved in cell wall biosynthesis